MANQRIYQMKFSDIYPLYIAKAERKGRSKLEVDQIIFWLTGYNDAELQNILKTGVVFTDFFNNAPKLNPKRKEITGMICGIRIEEIQEPLMREIRYLDKLIDELARGRSLTKLFRD